MIRVVPTGGGHVVQDDRRQLYLHADGRWRVVPYDFESSVAATEALRAQHRRYELANC